MNKKLLVGAVVGAALASGAVALAGYKAANSIYEVTITTDVDGTTPEIYGSLAAARASSDSYQFIGCAAQSKRGTSEPWGGCFARDASNKSISCLWDGSAWAALVSSIGPTSYIRFWIDPDGVHCSDLQVSNFSYLPQATESGATSTALPTGCTNPITFPSNGQSGNFNTTGAVCYRTAATIAGWGCSNFDGRTVAVDNTSVTCGSSLPARWSDGYYYFVVSAGDNSYANIYYW